MLAAGKSGCPGKLHGYNIHKTLQFCISPSFSLSLTHPLTPRAAVRARLQHTSLAVPHRRATQKVELHHVHFKVLCKSNHS